MSRLRATLRLSEAGEALFENLPPEASQDTFIVPHTQQPAGKPRW